MKTEPIDSVSPSQRLRDIAVAYHAVRAAGQSPNAEELLARYPDLADQLRSLLTGTETIALAAGNGTPVVPLADAPTLDSEGAPSGIVARFGRHFGEYE